MEGLIPKEKQLYLPYSKRIVSIVYHDAYQVFASLLSCPLLNRDKTILFHAHKDPFVEPSKSRRHQHRSLLPENIQRTCQEKGC